MPRDEPAGRFGDCAGGETAAQTEVMANAANRRTNRIPGVYCRDRLTSRSWLAAHGGSAARLFEAVYVRDVRMVQGRERLRFAREPGESIGIARE